MRINSLPTSVSQRSNGLGQLQLAVMASYGGGYTCEPSGALRHALFAHHVSSSFNPFLHSHPSGSMSSPSSSPNVSFSRFQDLFNAALREYSQKTGNDIATDPLTASLLPCNSSDAVLAILQEQAHAFNQFRNGDWKVQLMRRLKPIVDILLELSTNGIFGEDIGLVRLTKNRHILSKVHHIPYRAFQQQKRYLPVLVSYSQYVSIYLFACVCNLDTQILKAAKGVSTTYDALIELFESFEHYLGRLKVLTKIPGAVGEIFVKIMVQLLEVLALATQQIKQGRFSEFVVADTSRLA